MGTLQANIIAALQKDILLLSGFKPMAATNGNQGCLGIIKEAFPNNTFPLGAIHEFFCTAHHDASATSGFIAGILSSLVSQAGIAVWISSSPTIFPPALQQFGIDPSRVIFIHPRTSKDILFVTEEALKCQGITAVVANIKEISFTESRRFQLAVEQSNVTAFIIRDNPKNLSTAAVTRWKINHLPSATIDDLPGIGFPRWSVELLKVRNGKPGTWQVQWNAGKFNLVTEHQQAIVEPLRKIG